jgi:DNA modification methylase
MVEMWDDLFAGRRPEISSLLSDTATMADASEAFELMHEDLDAVWAACAPKISDGGLMCINIGDATRTAGGVFQLFANKTRIESWFATREEFHLLPSIIWRKPTNSPTKFMGSGTMPPNAYVTVEREHVIIARKGGLRQFQAAENRHESSYFWEERNQWFSDLWTDIRGERQSIDSEARDRAASFPFELPYRLISMFSVYGDTVLDPFWGTGTTTLAAMVAGRSSVGIELEPALIDGFSDRAQTVAHLSERVFDRRLEKHLAFVDEQGEDAFKYTSETYGFPVKTTYERPLVFYQVTGVEDTRTADTVVYKTEHEPVRLN